MQLRIDLHHVKALLNGISVEILQLVVTKLLRQNMQCFVLVGKTFFICLKVKEKPENIQKLKTVKKTILKISKLQIKISRL